MIDVLIWFFVGLAGLSALAMVFTKNVMHGAFLLILCLLSLAGLYVLYGAVYLAIVQLMVYAGGVLILFAFGIMLTNRIKGGQLLSKHHLLFGGILSSVGLLLILVLVLKNVSIPSVTNEVVNSVENIGVGFMTDYLLGFELIAYLLLVVLVGASYYAKSSQA